MKTIKNPIAHLNPENYTITLGSCQYDYIGFVTGWALKSLETLGMEAFCKLLGITELETKEEHLARLQNIFLENEEDRNISSIPEFYQLTRDYAWDLWSAGDGPAKKIPDFQLKDNISYESGIYPEDFNESLNNDEAGKLAINLALSIYLGWVEIEDIAGFDT